MSWGGWLGLGAMGWVPWGGCHGVGATVGLLKDEIT